MSTTSSCRIVNTVNSSKQNYNGEIHEFYTYTYRRRYVHLRNNGITVRMSNKFSIQI